MNLTRWRREAQALLKLLGPHVRARLQAADGDFLERAPISVDDVLSHLSGATTLAFNAVTDPHGHKTKTPTTRLAAWDIDAGAQKRLDLLASRISASGLFEASICT